MQALKRENTKGKLNEIIVGSSSSIHPKTDYLHNTPKQDTQTFHGTFKASSFILKQYTQKQIHTKDMKKKISQSQQFSQKAFTLTELMVAVAIIGILSAIAIPNYMNSLRFAKQKEAEIVISTVLTSISSFDEEYGRIPKGWDDLDKTQPLRTATGVASGSSYSQVQLPGGDYSLEGSINANTVVLEADTSNTWNVVGCINITNGLSAIKKGPITNNNGQEAEQTIDPVKDCPG